MKWGTWNFLFLTFNFLSQGVGGSREGWHMRALFGPSGSHWQRGVNRCFCLRRWGAAGGAGVWVGTQLHKILKSSQCCMGVFTGFPLLWRLGGVCLKKTANQAENEATVCVRSCVLELKRKGKKKEKQRSLTQIWIYGRLERKPQPTKKPLTLSSNRKSDLFIYVCSIFPAIRRPRVSPRSEQLDLWFVHSREPLQRHRAKTRWVLLNGALVGAWQSLVFAWRRMLIPLTSYILQHTPLCYLIRMPLCLTGKAWTWLVR